MKLLARTRSIIAVAALAVAVSASVAGAQEFTESHLKAARAAITALGTTTIFDAILPQAALALKDQMIQQNPNMQELIENTVNEKAIGLAGRRGDLEKEAATAYAKVFTEADLNNIAAFYSSETGKKLLSDGVIVNREVAKAADIWQRGIARDLATQVAEVLAKAGAAAEAQPAANGEAPAKPAPN